MPDFNNFFTAISILNNDNYIFLESTTLPQAKRFIHLLYCKSAYNIKNLNAQALEIHLDRADKKTTPEKQFTLSTIKEIFIGIKNFTLHEIIAIQNFLYNPSFAAFLETQTIEEHHHNLCIIAKFAQLIDISIAKAKHKDIAEPCKPNTAQWHLQNLAAKPPEQTTTTINIIKAFTESLISKDSAKQTIHNICTALNIHNKYFTLNFQSSTTAILLYMIYNIPYNNKIPHSESETLKQHKLFPLYEALHAYVYQADETEFYTRVDFFLSVIQDFALLTTQELKSNAVYLQQLQFIYNKIQHNKLQLQYKAEQNSKTQDSQTTTAPDSQLKTYHQNLQSLLDVIQHPNFIYEKYTQYLLLINTLTYTKHLTLHHSQYIEFLHKIKIDEALGAKIKQNKMTLLPHTKKMAISTKNDIPILSIASHAAGQSVQEIKHTSYENTTYIMHGKTHSTFTIKNITQISSLLIGNKAIENSQLDEIQNDARGDISTLKKINLI